jgi:two-component system, NtrC family, sensor kinase
VYGIQNDPENHEQTRQYLALINEGLEQIESVVTKLLGYSRQRPKTPEVIQPEKPVKVVLDLLKYRINEKNVQVTIDQAPDLPTLKADPNLIQEMLMNLILNSLDAVGDNGKIAIGINKSGPGNLELTVFDNGMGIPDDEQEKIFDPFYTTKDTGKGTGLGLSVTLGIVEAHNGTIRVQSQPGAGTTFTITLPAEEK